MCLVDDLCPIQGEATGTRHVNCIFSILILNIIFLKYYRSYGSWTNCSCLLSLNVLSTNLYADEQKIPSLRCYSKNIFLGVGTLNKMGLFTADLSSDG